MPRIVLCIQIRTKVLALKTLNYTVWCDIYYLQSKDKARLLNHVCNIYSGILT